ncbi:MAG: hypothetical protein WA821_08200 [Anaerolineales bacterium]
MKIKNILVMLVLLLVACNAPAPQLLQAMPTQPAVLLPATGIRYHFVTNHLLIPATQEQTQAYGLNIDGDPQQKSENLFGNLLTMLVAAAPGLELQATIDQAVNAGQIVTLHVLHANSLVNDPNASWSIFLGQTAPSAPRFNGADKFTIDPAAPTNSLIAGPMVNGHFSGGIGAVRIQMVILGAPVVVNLIGVRVEADVTEKGCINGKLGGGITAEEFRSQILPALADGLNRIIKANKTAATTILQVFDADRNGVISPAEIGDNLVLKLALSPDLDLLDASGKFNPRQDGVKDSMSIGLGFACVPAIFTAPGD